MKSRIEDFFWFFIGGVLGFIILTALTGCLEWGPTLKEQGRVAKLTYIPSTEQTDLMFFPHGNGGGSVGFAATAPGTSSSSNAPTGASRSTAKTSGSVSRRAKT